MSHRKPNLTIQIQQLPQEYNSKFKGYVQYPNASPQNIQYVQHQQIHVSRVSNQSNRSNHSNVSNRSALLERADRYMVESRLAQNIKSLSKNKFKTMSNSRTTEQNQRQYLQPNEARYSNTKRSSASKKQMIRSKSASNVELGDSRAKILQEIADKLKKIGKHHREYDENQNKSHLSNSRLNTDQQQTNKSRVEKIKQLKQNLSKARGGKLQHLLKDIKRSNKQAYKVVYTIKKSSNNGTSPFQKSLQMRDKINQEVKRNGQTTSKIVGTNLFGGSPSIQSTSGHKNSVINSNLPNLKLLADELHNVRLQLKEVKSKNQQLLNISQLRSQSDAFSRHHNQSASQSSRITRQIETLQFDAVSNGSNHNANFTKNANNMQHNNNASHLQVQQMQPTFAKTQTYAYYNTNNGQSYVVLKEPDVLQACFACGCTCRSKANIIK